MTENATAVNEKGNIGNPVNPITQLRTQSTIYRRHQARRARTLAKLNNRRALHQSHDSSDSFSSGDKSGKLSSPDQSQLTLQPPSPSFGQEDTIFTTHSTPSGASQAEGKGAPVFQVFLAACVGGAAAECSFRGQATQSASFVSPARTPQALSLLFSKAASSSPKLYGESGGVLAAAAFPHHPSSSSSSYPFAGSSSVLQGGRRSVTTNASIASAAFGAGTLFGSHHFLRRLLCGDEDKSSDNGSVTLNFVTASALTGTVTGTLFAPIELVQSRLAWYQTLSGTSPSSHGIRTYLREFLALSASRDGIAGLYQSSRLIYAREMVGATAYFVTYEVVKSHLSSRRNNPTISSQPHLTPHPMDIAIAGAAAGLGRHFVTSAVTGSFRGFIPALVRVAPVNAVLFFVYEMALNRLPSSPSSVQGRQ